MRAHSCTHANDISVSRWHHNVRDQTLQHACSPRNMAFNKTCIGLDSGDRRVLACHRCLLETYVRPFSVSDRMTVLDSTQVVEKINHIAIETTSTPTGPLPTWLLPRPTSNAFLCIIHSKRPHDWIRRLNSRQQTRIDRCEGCARLTLRQPFFLLLPPLRLLSPP